MKEEETGYSGSRTQLLLFSFSYRCLYFSSRCKDGLLDLILSRESVVFLEEKRKRVFLAFTLALWCSRV
jgi:hypothetical protein